MKTIDCRCGAVLVVPPGAPSMVCATCMRTHVLSVEQDLGTADTMAAIQFDPKLVPMSQPPPAIPVTKRGVEPSPIGRPSQHLIEPIATHVPPSRRTGHPERAVHFEAQRAATAEPRARPAWPLALAIVIVVAVVAVAIALAAR